MLVLVRMLILRTLVKRATVHNNGDGGVNVIPILLMLDVNVIYLLLMLETMLRDPEIFWFLNIFVNIYQSYREFHARASAGAVHTNLKAYKTPPTDWREF
jgi:hypothetical protein